MKITSRFIDDIINLINNNSNTIKVLYRPHRSTLSESLDELKEFSSINELLNYLVKNTDYGFYNQMFSYEDIYLDTYCFDSRLNLLTFVVCITKFGDEIFSFPRALGFMHIKILEVDK